MRLDIEKDINMLNKIDMYSLEENIFQKFWEWVKKILRKIIDFLKMIWQKIKSFFKGKKGDVVQKKAQEIQEEVNQTQTFDPEVFKATQVDDTTPNPQSQMENVKNTSKKTHIDLNQFNAMVSTKGCPIIDSEEVFENLKIPLREHLKKHWIEPDDIFSKFDLFNVSLEKIVKEKNFDELDQIAEDISKKPLIDQMKDPEEFFLITIYGDVKKKKTPETISIYEFFNKDDMLIKKFVNFMASNKLYGSFFNENALIDDLISKSNSLYKNIETMARKHYNMLQLGLMGNQIKQLHNKIESITKIYLQTLTSYGNVISDYNLRRLNLINVFQTIINHITRID